MILLKKRKGASFVIMVIIMAFVMSGFAIAISINSTSRSSNLTNKDIEKQLSYLAQDAVNQMIYKLNTGATDPISLTVATELGSLFKYEAYYDSANEPFNAGDGTIVGKAYLMAAGDPNNTSAAIYTKIVYYAVKAGGSGNPIMVYIKTSGGSQNIPFYRIWNSTTQTWGEELQANPCASGIFNSTNVHLQFITLSFDPGSAKAMLVMEDDMGNIWAEEWSGSSWSSAMLVYNGGNTTQRTFFCRSFSLSYETAKTSGVNRAVLVYADKRSSIHIPYYSIWNGSSWSAGSAIYTSPLTGQPYFIKTTPCPKANSQNIGLIWQDSNRDVFGEGWNGTSWTNMGYSSTWSTNVVNVNGRSVGIAAEQSSGDIIFVYAEKSGQWELFYKVWNGTTLTSESAIGATWKDSVRWIDLTAVPGTDQILLAYVTDNTANTLWTNTWSGTAWGASSTNQGTVYAGYALQYFDTACSGDAAATLVYSSGANTLLRRSWAGGTTWSAATTMASGWTRSYGIAVASKSLGNVFTAFYSEVANGNLIEYHTNSSSVWQTSTNIFTGLTLNPPYERVVISVPTNSSGYTGVRGTWRETY